MKRCPACKRVEPDDALVFCCADGTALISESGSVSGDVGTMKFGSAPGLSEIETSVLPHTSTTPEINRPTAPTTVLPAPPLGTTNALVKPNRRKAAMVVTLLITAVVALAIVVSGYFYYSRKNNTAIESIAVLPFENRSSNSDTDYLSDGLADSLIYRLSQLPNLKVMSRNTAFRYKGLCCVRQKDDALKTLDQLTVIARQRYFSEYSWAIIYAGLGEKDQALNWLEKGYEGRASKMNFLQIEPFFDNLRSDPRFADLVRRVGLPQ